MSVGYKELELLLIDIENNEELYEEYEEWLDRVAEDQARDVCLILDTWGPTNARMHKVVSVNI